MKRRSIEFVRAGKAIRDPVTKFGGQPVWIEGPQWPLSAETGRQMRFLCQIAIEPDLFGSVVPRMAYVFMTDEDEYVDGTWDPDGGENAVILQPGSTSLPVRPLAEGPTLYQMVKKRLRTGLIPEPCEFAVRTTLSEDPAFVPEAERAGWSEGEWGAYADVLEGNKVGGTPIFWQADEFPGPGSWRLLLQLDSTRVPFFVNFGDAGTGYAFLSAEGTEARFLWQAG